MEKGNIVFSFLDTKDTFEFSNGFSYVSNKRLLQTIKSENFKNYESSLVIKSLNDTKINEVTQLKISIHYIGYFLVNFPFEENAKEKYAPIVNEIKLLKDESEDKDSQLLKIEKVLNILNKYNPIYSVFIGKNDVFEYSEAEPLVGPVEVIDVVDDITAPGSGEEIIVFFTIEFSNASSTFYKLNKETGFYNKNEAGNSNCYEGLSFSKLEFSLN